MIADRVRIDAYAQALRQTVRPDSVVADIGTGTGIFALLACRFGARRVYAIEPDAVIQVAREIAQANGCAERIEFLEGLSTEVALPERADVIVSDLRGILPWHVHHIPSIVDARRRFLAPGGTLIPQRDTLWAAPIEAAERHRALVGAGDEQLNGLDLGLMRWLASNTWEKARVRAEQLLSPPQCWASLDYTTVESANACAEIRWNVARAATGHGIVAWFDATLADGVFFSNSPDAPEAIYGSAFFPWLEPVALQAGDVISLKLEANLVGEEYVWSWYTCVLNQGRPGQVKANFQQSTFFGSPLSLKRLRKLAAGHVPTRNEDGQIDHFILAQMDGQVPLGEIARRVVERFPSRFAKWENALTRVTELSQRYSR
jgi:SAM-dependent methyltransferase